MMNTKLLNAVVAYLRSQGVAVEPNEATANAIVSLCITTLSETGMSVAKAMDVVLGAGTFQKIADQVWEINNAA